MVYKLITALLAVLCVSLDAAQTSVLRHYIRSVASTDALLAQAQALPVIYDTAWDTTLPANWNVVPHCEVMPYQTVTCPTVVTDATAPRSCCNVLRFDYTNVGPDIGPANYYILWPDKNEVYVEFWFKVSPNWHTNPAGGGKTFYVWNDGGSMWSGAFCVTQFGTCPSWPNDTPMAYGFWLQWQGPPPDSTVYGDFTRMPNVTTTTFTRNQWVKVGKYLKEETVPGSSRDGIIRIWINDVLNENYTNISTPGSGFNELHLDPIKQIASEMGVTEYMFVDHLRIQGGP